jgi:nucleotide-binding universal stress UspA family protein
VSATARAPQDPHDWDGARFGRMLLATEGRPIPEAAIRRVIELADPHGASVRVLSIARVHGTSFGMPTPCLLPSRDEWRQQQEIVTKAIKRLKRKGLEADGHVVGTRKSTKKICEEATMQECEAIVMAADPDRHRLIADALWSQEPQRVRRKAKVPVFLVPDDAG